MTFDPHVTANLLDYVMHGAIRNLDGRCAECARPYEGGLDDEDYVVQVTVPGWSTADYELGICPRCARKIETRLIKARRR